MGMFWITIPLLFSVLQVQASPITKTKIDRHQEGKSNVKFDLENVLILIMPSSSASSNSSSDNILKFLSRSLPLHYITQARKHLAEEDEEIEDEFVPDDFIESRTAPYHVDISRAKSHLAKLYPEVKLSESIVARSPSVHLAKSNDFSHHRKHGSRNARAFLITVPVENEYISGDIKNALESKTEDVLKKSIGLSMEAINNGLVEQLKQQQQTQDIDIVEPDVKIIKLSENGDVNNIEKIDDEIKNSDNVSQAMIVAKAIKNVLLGYFKKLAEEIKEKNDKIEINVPEITSTEKIKTITKKNSDGQGVYTKKHENNLKNKKEEIVKIGPKPIKNYDDIKDQDDRKGSLSSPKEELLLLGAENEQCGPGQERDANGICITSYNI